MVNDIISPCMFGYPDVTYINGVKHVLEYFKQTENGYEAVYKEDDQSKNSMTANEVLKIIESSNISKENKSKIREFIERVI